MPQDLAQKLPGVGICYLRDLFRRALRNHVAAAISALGTEIDNVVGGLYHFEIVLDDDDRVAGVG